MGVTYKLKDEVVDFIISQRRGNPLASCRQLAEAASQRFGLQLSKSSVHDVLKESGIITPRGRKPKDKFQIPQEKKQQIQVSLSQTKLLPPPVQDEQPKVSLIADVIAVKDPAQYPPNNGAISPSPANDFEISPEYEGAGRIFLKAALWDLGIFNEENIKPADWAYYSTYCKGIRVVLENDKSFFIDMPLPIERCIRETADGLINNIRPLIVGKVSDPELFKACMDASAGFKMDNVSIVDENDHNLLKITDIVEQKRKFELNDRLFVYANENNADERLKRLFFPQIIDNNEVVDNILNLRGFDTVNKDENVVTLLMNDSYENKLMLQKAIEKLNGMCIYDEQGRLLRLKNSCLG